VKTLHTAYRVTDLAASAPTPDGYRIELVQWPPGHADGISPADFG
jgi:hypothetical protein